jgi:[protein-PII] uridylyltransferase
MNEAGVFGRFIPDFGRVVARMQFDMYHHYTVDEHSIRAIGLLSRIERGELADDHPLSTALFRQSLARVSMSRPHDIAMGRVATIAPAEVAMQFARFGLDEAETETVARQLSFAAVEYRLPPRPRRPQRSRLSALQSPEVGLC